MYGTVSTFRIEFVEQVGFVTREARRLGSLGLEQQFAARLVEPELSRRQPRRIEVGRQQRWAWRLIERSFVFQPWIVVPRVFVARLEPLGFVGRSFVEPRGLELQPFRLVLRRFILRRQSSGRRWFGLARQAIRSALVGRSRQERGERLRPLRRAGH